MAQERPIGRSRLQGAPSVASLSLSSFSLQHPPHSLEISLSDNLQDINFWNSRKGVLAHRELVDIEGPNRVGAVGESIKNSHRIPVVHGYGDLRFQQLHDLFACLRPRCKRAANHLEKDVHMSDQLELVFIERLTHITGVKNTETI